MVYLGTDSLDSGGRPLDLRLLLPAVSTWAVTWTLLGGSARAAAWAAAAAAVCALAAAALWLRWRTAASAPALAAYAAGILLLSLVCSAAGALAVSGRHAAAAGSPVTAAAAEEHSAELGVVVSRDPRVRAGPPQPGRPELVIEARTEWIDSAGERVGTRVPVVILASGPQWQQLVPSQRLTLSGRLVPADSEDFTAALVLVRGPPQEVGEPRWEHRAAGDVREGLREASSVLPQPERGLVPALVLGDVSELPEETAEDFRATSMTHIMVPSGAKLAIMMGCVLGITLALRAPPFLRVAAGAAMIAVFVLLCRPEPSVLRAAVMGSIGLVALALGRPRAGFAALAASVIGLLLFSPELARSYGFALSVLATAGLLVLAPRWRDRWRPWMGPALAEACAVALAAQVAVYPLLVLLSAEVSLVAVPANMFAAIMVPPATIAGFITAGLALVSMPLAQLAVWAPATAAAWINAVAEHGAALPFSAVPWPGDLAGAATLAVLLAVVVAARGRIGGLLALGTTAVLVTAVAVQALAPVWPPRDWVLAACDVGQGDALVLATEGAGGVVVDTGPDPILLHRCLRELGIRRVDLVVLTHDHDDHVGGIPGVLRHREVRAALAPPSFPGTSSAPLLAAAGVPLHSAQPGQRFSAGAWEFLVLWPEPEPGPAPGVNDESVVLRARFGADSGRGPPWTVLLTGDIEEPSQRALLGSPQIDADILKTPHHGAGTTDPAFLEAVSPAITITQLGADNPHGHPHPRTWGALTELTDRNYRTDLHGDIAVVAGPDGPVVVYRGVDGPR